MVDIRSITTDELDRLGIDESNKLYWDGMQVVTDQKLVFEWWVNWAVILTAASTLALAAIEILEVLGPVS
jgi:hypothetical protein